MKKILMQVILLLAAALVAACSNRRGNAGVGELMIDRDVLIFARNTLMFDLRIVVDGVIYETNNECRRAMSYVRDLIWPTSHNRINRSYYTELMFVRNHEESQNFPDNVIVAWPSGSNGMHSSLMTMNWFINRTVDEIPRDRGNLERQPVILEDFGLTHPIDMIDLMENVEQVLAVFKALTWTERLDITP